MAKRVALVMGSDSDLPVVQKAIDVLAKLEIEYEARIISAHRTPEVAAEFAKMAQQRGFGVIVAFAGMAAHLAGVLAGHTLLPVVGVPCKGGAMDGLDALLATVQMPGGVPVATVALNGGVNAAILAAQMLALSDDALAERLAAMRRGMTEDVIKKDVKLQNKINQ